MVSRHRFAVVVLAPLIAGCGHAHPAPRQEPVASAAPPAERQVDSISRREPLEDPGGEASHLHNTRQLTSIGRNGEAVLDESGEYIAFQTLRPPVAFERLAVVSRDGQGEHFIATLDRPLTGPAWIGDALLASSREVPAGPWQLVWLPPESSGPFDLGPLGRLVDVRDSVFAPRARQLFVSARGDRGREIRVFDPALGEVQSLHPGDEIEGAPAPTPDGDLVAFWRELGPGHREIFVTERARRRTRRLTALGGIAWAPTMHPSGEWVVFGSDYYGRSDHDLLAVNVQSLVVVRITYHPGFDGLPRFGPRGEQLLWTSSRGGGVPQVFIADWRMLPN